MNRPRWRPADRHDGPMSMVRRMCIARTNAGRVCHANPVSDSAYCYRHDPGSAEEAAEASRRGGLRHKAERLMAASVDFQGLGSVDAIQRALEIPYYEVIPLERTTERSRTMVSAALGAMKLLPFRELADRMARLEAALEARLDPMKTITFPAEPDESDGHDDEAA